MNRFIITSRVPPVGAAKSASMISLVTVVPTILMFWMKYAVSKRARARKGIRRSRMLSLSLPGCRTHLQALRPENVNTAKTTIATATSTISARRSTNVLK